MDKKIDSSQLRRERLGKLLRYGVPALLIAGSLVFVLSRLTRTVDSRDLQFSVVDEGTLETAILGSGSVVPEYEVTVNSPVNSHILRIHALPGDTVTKGEPLIDLDLESAETDYTKILDQFEIRQHELTQLQINNRTALSELAMQIRVKEMELNQLSIEAQNERRLDSIGSGTGDRVRQAETALARSRIELEQMRERLANEKLRMAAAEKSLQLSVNSLSKDVELHRRTLERGHIPAPIDGVLTYISNEIGSRVGAGEKVAVVSDLSSFKINGRVADGFSDKVTVGAAVTARIGKTELSGIISNVTPQSNSGTMAFSVRLNDSHNPRLHSGLSTELAVKYGIKEGVRRVANGSFYRGPGDYSLFVLTDDDTAERRNVRLGDSNREYVEVVSGLTTGETVVTTLPEKYYSRKKIRIKRNGNH